MKRSSGPRKAANLSESVNHHLNMYVLSAGAAGIGMLTSVTPVEARIIYTAAHVRISYTSPLFLDLNHDGVTDFAISNAYRETQSDGLLDAQLNARGKSKGAAVAGKTFIGTTSYVYALARGSKIGPSRPFSGYNMLYIGYRGILGKWANVKGRYLGLRFQIKGRVHYGWARLNVEFVNGDGVGIAATLTGYAYETIPGKAIIAGQTRGPDDISIEEQHASLTMPSPEPATLGALAMGAPGLSIWRREERRSHLDS
jgi:hypothetical protein